MKYLVAIVCILELSGCGDNLSYESELVDGGDSIYDDNSGAECAEDYECSSNLCLTQFSDEDIVPGGMCTAKCVAGPPDGENGCKADTETCLVNLATEKAYCFPKCLAVDSCREDWQCINLGFFEPAWVCIP